MKIFLSGNFITHLRQFGSRLNNRDEKGILLNSGAIPVAVRSHSFNNTIE